MYSRIKRFIRVKNAGQFDNWWRKVMPRRFKTLGAKDPDNEWDTSENFFEAQLSIPPALDFPRQTLARWLMIRSGHGPFARYHDTYKHADAPRHCSCGHLRTPEHIAYCPKMLRKRHLWVVDKGTLPPTSPQDWFMRMVEDCELFARIERESGYYTKICPSSTTWRHSKQEMLVKKVKKKGGDEAQAGAVEASK
jgi:hypothetical protein